MRTIHFIHAAIILLLATGTGVAQTHDEVSKIYLFGSTLLRTTPGKDIKLYDISNPRSPWVRATISIEHNHDVAMVSNALYADSGPNLIVYDLSVLSNPIPVDTIGNIFRAFVNTGAWRMSRGDLEDMPLSTSVRTQSASSISSSSSSGTAGSLARFSIVGHYLYCLDHNNLYVLDISDPLHPRYLNSVALGSGIETVFPHEGRLFVGTMTGMLIYDIQDPEKPKFISSFAHVRSCDPVVVEGNRAYVTLRQGSRCGGGVNRLDVVDISDIRNPRLLGQAEMSGPYGLGVRDGIVTVCDGKAGLMIYDASNPSNIRRIGGLRDIVPYDVIIQENLMIVTAESGFYLYWVRDLEHPVLYGELDGKGELR